MIVPSVVEAPLLARFLIAKKYATAPTGGSRIMMIIQTKCSRL
jgi:hypothetical protein